MRVSEGLPPPLNPFYEDKVSIKAALIPGEAQNSKTYVAREGILDGVSRGLITPATTVVEATSGNTGQGMAAVCSALGLRFLAVMAGDVPQEKINAIRVIGRGVSVHMMFDEEQTPVAYAREAGKRQGWYNPCQYDGLWNVQAHYRYLAPQLWEQEPEVSVIAAPAGTMGTCLGLVTYAHDNRHQTVVVPVFCAEGEEVPGARSKLAVETEVRQPWRDFFPDDEDVEFGTRHGAFLASFLSWTHLPLHPGPSFGLGLVGALRFLRRHKSAGTLDRFRGKDGVVRVVVIAPDDSRPYLPLYFGELRRRTEFSGTVGPRGLLPLLEI